MNNRERDYGAGTLWESRTFLIDFLVIICILCRLGFPGNLSMVVGGETVKKLMDYGSSLLQVGLMFLASGENLEDICVFNFKKKYYAIYVMLLVIVIVSMMVTDNHTKQTTLTIHFTITALFGLWLADYYKIKKLLELIYTSQVVIIISNLLLLFVFPAAGYYFDEGYGYIYRGIFAQKNGLGGEAAICLVLQVLLFYLKRKDGEDVSKNYYAIMLIQGFFIVISQSTTAVFVALIPVLYLILFRKKIEKGHRLPWGIIYATVSIGFLFSALTIMPLFSPVLEAMGKDATLSNRTPMWEGIIQFMQESHTFTGYGLFHFWETPSALRTLQNMFPRKSWYRSMTYGSHNNLLELWLDTGLIGVSAYLLLFIDCFRNVKKLNDEQYLLCSMLVIPNLICGLPSRLYTNDNYQSLLLFLLWGVACSWPRPEIRIRKYKQEELYQ